MIIIPEVRTGPIVKQYVNDEIHITGKQIKQPKAVISFVAVDDNGNRIEDAPAAVFVIKGSAFNYWYEGWDGETSLYNETLHLLASQDPDVTVSGVDLSRIGGINEITLPNQIPEVLNLVSV